MKDQDLEKASPTGGEAENAADDEVSGFSFVEPWQANYPALPDLSPPANAIAIEHIKLENEGWEQDIVP